LIESTEGLSFRKKFESGRPFKDYRGIRSSNPESLCKTRDTDIPAA